MPEVEVRVPEILDPRPLVRSVARPLAPRLPTLEGTRLVLVDNGDLRHWEGDQPMVYPTLTQRLQAQYGVATCQRLTRVLHGGRPGGVREVTAEIRSRRADGVVIALCEAANSASTLVLAWELERQGVPTVMICHAPAIPVAAAMTAHVFPGLPLSPLVARRPSSAPEVMAEMVWVAGEIEEGLTASPDTLVAHFNQRYMAMPERFQVDDSGHVAIWASPRLEIIAGAIELDPSGYAVDFYEAYTEYGFGDGLPMLPPTRERVEAMLERTDRSPTDRVVPRCFPSGLPLTVGTLAIHAVMAGCQPTLFPLLLAAGAAVADSRYRLAQAEMESQSSAPTIILSGPLAEQAGIASQAGCLGPGLRANLTLRRALYLALANASYPISQHVSLAPLGSLVQTGFCCAENRESSPWPAFHLEHFDADTTCITVMSCEGLFPLEVSVGVDPEVLLRQIVDVVVTVGRYRPALPSNLLVLLNPAHAHWLQSSGWGKPDIQDHLVNHLSALPYTAQLEDGAESRRTAELTPDRILIVVAGADGTQSMIGLSWGSSQAVTQGVTHVDGRPVRDLDGL